MIHVKNFAIQTALDYREENNITSEDAIEIAAPGDEAWEQWLEDNDIEMTGNPRTAILALCVAGYAGMWHDSLSDFMASLPLYFTGM